jgi:hypothetical protein
VGFSRQSSLVVFDGFVGLPFITGMIPIHQVLRGTKFFFANFYPIHPIKLAKLQPKTSYFYPFFLKPIRFIKLPSNSANSAQQIGLQVWLSIERLQLSALSHALRWMETQRCGCLLGHG